ncbi:MAG: nuclear transport factor 2 family protein [Acidimicrobiales bacterium]
MSEGTGAHVADLEAVTELIGLYIDGAAGEVAKLRKAFHADAQMMGHIGPMNTYFPITEFFKMVEANPGMAGPGYKAVIQSIDLTGDAGVAVLAETDYLGCDFVDYFSVAKVEGEWKITNKTYAHTGGTPPAS